MSEENIEVKGNEAELQKIQELMDQLDQKIDKEKYDELQEKYDNLLNNYVNRRPERKPEVKVLRPARDIANELRDIKDGDLSNRKYIEKSLEYRESYMAETGKDPWTDFGVQGSGKATAQTEKVAGVLKQLLTDNPTDVGFRIALHEMMEDDKNVIAVLAERKKELNKKERGR